MKSRRRQKKEIRKIYAILIILISLFLVFLIIYEKTTPILAATSLKDFVKAEINIKPQTIIAKAGCYEIEMLTTDEQIESIARVLENSTLVRPNAHDLLVYALKNFEISSLFVKIHSLQDGTYFANLLLKKGNKILILDSRPSDAIAIALRLNIPIYVNSSLLQYGRKVC